MKQKTPCRNTFLFYMNCTYKINLTEMYYRNKFRNKKNTSAHKKASFLYAKIISEKFVVTYSFRVPKDFQQKPNGNTAVKFNDILHTTVKSEMKFNGNLHA